MPRNGLGWQIKKIIWCESAQHFFLKFSLPFANFFNIWRFCWKILIEKAKIGGHWVYSYKRGQLVTNRCRKRSLFTSAWRIPANGSAPRSKYSWKKGSSSIRQNVIGIACWYRRLWCSLSMRWNRCCRSRTRCSLSVRWNTGCRSRTRCSLSVRCNPCCRSRKRCSLSERWNPGFRSRTRCSLSVRWNPCFWSRTRCSLRWSPCCRSSARCSLSVRWNPGCRSRTRCSLSERWNSGCQPGLGVVWVCDGTPAADLGRVAVWGETRAADLGQGVVWVWGGNHAAAPGRGVVWGVRMKFYPS